MNWLFNKLERTIWKDRPVGRSFIQDRWVGTTGIPRGAVAAFLTIVFVLLPLRSGYAQDSRDLWSMAVGIASENSSWVPSESSIRTQIFNDTKLVRQNESSIERRIEDGRLVVRRTGNADGYSQRFQRNSDFDLDDFASSLLGSRSPFNADLQEDLLYLTRVGDQIMDGIPTVVFRFAVRYSEGIEAEGRAYLERSSGAPLKVEFSTITVPSENIEDLSITIHYDWQEDSHWYAIKHDISADVAAHLAIIGEIRRHIESEVRHTGYFQSPKGIIVTVDHTGS